MSLGEISKETGIPKTSIREALNAGGMALRSFSTCRSTPHSRTRVQIPGRPPYGYARLNGQLVIDPREYSTIQQILKLWKSGKSYNAISEILNKQKIQTRSHKPWIRCVVRSIIIRHESNFNNQLKG